LAALILFFSFFKEGEWLSNSRSSKCARTAFYFRNTIRIFTNEFTFRFRTGGFVAFPVTFRFFTNWFTFWFRSLAMSNAMWLFANSYTFWTVKHFTSFIRAFNFTFGFFTFNITDCVFGFGA
jgi:hypothetical protein